MGSQCDGYDKIVIVTDIHVLLISDIRLRNISSGRRGDKHENDYIPPELFTAA